MIKDCSDKIAVIMGSLSDLSTMQSAIDILIELKIDHEVKIVSAHRTPERLYSFAKSAENHYAAIIAGAGGAAHLPGMVAALTWVPVFGVPVNITALNGMDSLMSIVQMPGGIPVNTHSIGKSGAKNAALAVTALLAVYNDDIRKRLKAFRQKQTEAVVENLHSE